VWRFGGVRKSSALHAWIRPRRPVKPLHAETQQRNTKPTYQFLLSRQKIKHLAMLFPKITSFGSHFWAFGRV
jgi:hypothetical protein